MWFHSGILSSQKLANLRENANGFEKFWGVFESFGKFCRFLGYFRIVWGRI
jgi:hypothetical protein